jgi:TonB family protein
LSGAHELLARVSAWLWPAVANHLWQATLFAALVWGLTLLLRGAPARVRYALWLVASAKFAVPAALVALLAALSGVGVTGLADARAGASAPLVLQLAEPLRADASNLVVTVQGATPAHGELWCALTLLWLAGGAVLFGFWWKRRREFSRSVREGRESYAGREFDALERARVRLGLVREVRLVLSPRRAEPGVWRTRRPVLLLPELVTEQLDDEELEAVLLHELAHVERRDNLFGNLQTALACVFWFHPAVWFVSRRLLAEREQACDERVLETGGAAGAYAASILKVVRFCSGWRVAGVSGAASGFNLRRRIEMILREDQSRRLSAWHRALTCALAASALALTVCAGLFSRAHTAVAASAGDDAQHAARVVVRDGGPAAEGNAVDGPAVREIEQATEAVVPFENVANAPLVINDAKMRLITQEQLRRADEEGAESFDDEETPFFVTLPTITLTNVSGKVVREVGIGFARGDKLGVVLGYATSLKPGAAETRRFGWRHNVIMPGGFADVSVRVVWVAFADGTQWGGRALAPHAPGSPPAPDEPGAPFGSVTLKRATPSEARGGGATAFGVVGGNGVATAVSAGTGVGGATAEGVGTGGGDGVGSGTGSEAGSEAGSGAGSGAGKGRGKGFTLKDQLISAPNPPYPPIAKAARAEGTVTVRITVDEDGNVISAEAVGGHPLLYTASVKAARGAKFRPTVVDGKPVKVTGVIGFNFVLEHKDDEDDGPQH